MPLINCEINFILAWSANQAISSNAAGNQAPIFAITDTKPYVPVVTLSTQDNAELVQQLKPNFKREIRWNKYQSEIERQAQNPYLDYLIDPCFQGVNRIFVFSSEDVAERTNHWNYFLPTVIINIYKIMIYGRNLFD